MTDYLLNTLVIAVWIVLSAATKPVNSPFWALLQ